MKKILAYVLCLCLLTSAAIAAFSLSSRANQIGEITGLRESMDALWLKNHFTKEEMAEIAQLRIDVYTESFWATPFEKRKEVELHIMKYPDNPEAELAHRLTMLEPLRVEDGIQGTLSNSRHLKYGNDYFQNGNFDYLFSDKTYWSIPYGDYESTRMTFTPDGKQHISNMLHYGGEDAVGLNVGMLAFLKDTDSIEAMLRDVGVAETYKAIISASPMCLYLHCDNGIYLVSLHDEPIHMMEPYGLYKLDDIMQLWTDEYHAGGNEGYGRFIVEEKPDFEDEALALQAAGLLHGNEKGLDLRKPLTRIEAITLLVRALGLEDAPTSNASKFTDIADSSWGRKYANIAADNNITLGIGNGQFAPNERVTDIQFGAFLLRAVNTPDFDWKASIKMLIDEGVLTAEDVKAMDLFTRGDMAKIIYEALEKELL